jgi:class 3 adenylate cyclase
MAGRRSRGSRSVGLASLMHLRLKEAPDLSLAELAGMWEALSSSADCRPPIVELLADRILRVGEPLFAYDVIQAGLARWPKRTRLRQLEGLALASSGATLPANQALLRLYRDGVSDGETLGLLARTYKDLWDLETDDRKRAVLLARSHEIYREAFEAASARRRRDDAIYVGINAASTAMLAERPRLARSLARRVQELCRLKLRGGPDYWARASLGEAAILLGDLDEAATQYAHAAELGAGNLRWLSRTRRQARTLLHCIREDRNRLDPIFAIPSVVIFSGHMIDRPKREQARFPPQLEPRVGREIAAKLEEIDAGIGYAAAACGADILFLESMLKRGSEIHVVLPFPKEVFRKTSIEIAPTGSWNRRFERVLAQAASVTITNPYDDRGSALSFEYEQKFSDGLASLRARTLDCDLVALAVWDGQPGDRTGGTASRVGRWREHGREIHIVALEPQDAPRRATSSRKSARGNEEKGHKLMAMLFADVVAYSRLSEEQIPRFVEHFLGRVSEVINRAGAQPVDRNTWGDALYFVFDSVAKAGRVGLELVDLMRTVDWKALGLPEDLDLRVALHAGPVFEFWDPVAERDSFNGSHVSHAARMEPVTPPGQVFASQGFATLSESEGEHEFTCEYIGQTPLAKGHGTFPVYRVAGSRS